MVDDNYANGEFAVYYSSQLRQNKGIFIYVVRHLLAHLL